MKSLPLLLLGWTVAELFGQTGRPSGEITPLAIYTQYAYPPSDESVTQMQGELEAILAPLGVHVAWRALDKADGREALTELIVVSFKGRCNTGGLPPAAPRSGPLGWTYTENQEVLPFSAVDCDRIRSLAGMPLAMNESPERDRMLGRAMGRVLAHEMFHYLANTMKHVPSGIAKAVYNATDLTCPELRFGEAELRQFRSGRLHPLVGEVDHPQPVGGG